MNTTIEVTGMLRKSQYSSVAAHEMFHVNFGTLGTETIYDSQPILRAVEKLLENRLLRRILA
jgi:hypothetical protein